MNKDDALAQRYEEIRRTFFDQHQGVPMWGLVILRSKGMAAWVKSWREYGGGDVARKPSDSSAPRAARISTNSEEVVRILVAMIWAVQEEGARHDA